MIRDAAQSGLQRLSPKVVEPTALVDVQASQCVLVSSALASAQEMMKLTGRMTCDPEQESSLVTLGVLNGAAWPALGTEAASALPPPVTSDAQQAAAARPVTRVNPARGIARLADDPPSPIRLASDLIAEILVRTVRSWHRGLRPT